MEFVGFGAGRESQGRKEASIIWKQLKTDCLRVCSILQEFHMRMLSLCYNC